MIERRSQCATRPDRTYIKQVLCKGSNLGGSDRDQLPLRRGTGQGRAGQCVIKNTTRRIILHQTLSVLAHLDNAPTVGI